MVKKKNLIQSNHTIQWSLGLIIILSLMLIGPFLQGFFFELQYLVVGLFIASAFVYHSMTKEIKTAHPNIMILLVLIAIIYTVAAVVNQMTLQSVNEALKIWILPLLYYFSSGLTENQQRFLLRTFVIGVLSANILGFVLQMFRNQRFEGLLEYANISALLLLVRY